MDRQDRRAISREYFGWDDIANHHFRSYNNFISTGMQEVIDNKEKVETDIGDKADENNVYIDLGNIRVENPRVEEADGSHEIIFPQDARFRNITYSAPLHMELAIVEEKDGGYVHDQKEVKVGGIPVMIGSSVCNTTNEDGTRIPPRDLMELGEDPADPGGYFIVNGSERVLMTSEDLAPNKILCEKDTKYGDEVYVSKVFSQRRGYRALVLVRLNRDRLLEVNFPSVSGSVPFTTLVRALGMKTDEEIVNSVSKDPDVVKHILENLETDSTSNEQEAIESIGKLVGKKSSKEYQITRAQYVIDNHLLPHLHEEGIPGEEVRYEKALYLCRMAERVYDMFLGNRKPDDKDHYANKRLRVSGDLMRDLFRAAINKLGRDMKYQLERANMRGRSFTIGTVVRADVLREKLEHPLATGNWVGGRSGVSQLVDRTDYMGVLSHLRRLKSPLSRSQPHFEARDLHATQWGRICPSETPEGPNCGLVKNLAQSMELSESVDDMQNLKRELSHMGVNSIINQQYSESSSDD